MINSILSWLNRDRSKTWDFDSIHQSLERAIAAATKKGAFHAKDFELLSEDIQHEIVVDIAHIILSSLKRRAPRMIREYKRFEEGFQERTYKRWRPGLDLVRMMLVISEEVGSAFIDSYLPKATQENDIRFEAIGNLHARALVVSNEIFTLLQHGFPDGALARWRTLHEIATIALFLSKNEKEISERYISHRSVMAYKVIKQYRQYQVRANLTLVTDDEEAVMKKDADDVASRWGAEMQTEYGWASPALKTKKVTLKCIEESLGLDHWRPRYRWASQENHGAFRPALSSLGASEAKHEVLLVGASNSGFADPAQMTAISMNVANHALLLLDPNMDRHIFLYLLRALSDEIGEVFYRISLETAPKHMKKS